MNYHRNNQSNSQNRPPFHNDRNNEQKKLFDIEKSKLDKARKDYQPSIIIDCAKEIAKKLDHIESSQTRKFLDEIVKIHPTQIDIKKEPGIPLEESIRNSLAILRPRFAYTVTKKGSKDLKAFYLEILDSWLADSKNFTTLDLELLHLFIESLIAYHKVYVKK